MKKTFVKIAGVGSVSILLSFLCFNSVFADFSDVPASDPQAHAIEDLQTKKVINGYANNTFQPNKLISKAEFLKMVFNDVGYSSYSAVSTTAFRDVPAGSWYAPYVEKALEINAISASGSNPLFQPGSSLTRANAIKIAFQIEGIPTPYSTNFDPGNLFTDVQPTAWYAYLASAAKIHQILYLANPGYFYANHLMTRGDAAELIDEIDQNNGNSGNSISVEPVSLTSSDETQSALDLMNNPEFSILVDVWQQASSKFYYQQNVNKNELLYGAIKGMVDKLGDQYTIFEEPSDALGLQDYLKGQFAGIGTVINLVSNKIVIMNTIPNSPAAKANLQTGDVIEDINNQAVANLTIDQALSMIRGDAGTTVHLTILRGTQTVEVDVTREEITLSSVSDKMINNTIGYLDVSEFTQNSSADFTAAIDDLSKSSPKAYILDLRGNPGGYLDSALQMLDNFVNKNTVVVSTKDVNGNITQLASSGPAELKGIPLVVLVDGDTASAAEIMAGALQDLKLAKLVGVKTFGKGSVQQISNYSDGSLLKITVAHWLTPNGRDINGQGLTPDVNVELDQTQLLNGTDSQLQKAISVLNGSMN